MAKTDKTASTKITFNLPVAEDQMLEGYCNTTGRSKTDVLREFIRSLKDESNIDKS